MTTFVCMGIKTGTPDDLPGIVGILVSAYYGDPLLRWLYPDHSVYLKAFPQLCKCLLEAAFSSGRVFLTKSDTGVAVWLHSSAKVNQQKIRKLHSEYLTSSVRSHLAKVSERQCRIYSGCREFWYLQPLAVSPEQQRKGIGAQILSDSLKLLDEEKLPCFLYTNLLSTVALYERVGFKVIEQFRVGDSPENYVMARKKVTHGASSD